MLRFWTRHKLMRQPFPSDWRALLDANVSPYCRLPAAGRSTLEKHVRIFLAEKQFEGCGGLEITEAMRVTVAGYACLLLLHDPAGYYPHLGTVVLYPKSFATPIVDTGHAGVITETIEERLGESWQEGTVVLAWDAVEELLCGESPDCNVIIHEFAHQIDTHLSHQPRWQELLTTEQMRQRTVRRRGRPAILDPYALTSTAELFAVASEIFFMRPIRLKANHPELYSELRAVYGIDPASWGLETGG